jgi:hypothetical protein
MRICEQILATECQALCGSSVKSVKWTLGEKFQKMAKSAPAIIKYFTNQLAKYVDETIVRGFVW